MKHVIVMTVAVLLVMAEGCSKQDTVPTDIVDQNQSITQANVTSNAHRYANEVFPGMDVRPLMQSDSSVTKDCRYGDGWGSGELIDNATGKSLGKIKCQTNGHGKGTFGCMPTADFQKKDYADQEGKCDLSITTLEKFSK
ncbi:MAG: hypothetical protein JHC33_11370 [Ignisphaera sp.]|nr:hypothetical protein [Ignisphaera sp.]